MHQCRKVRFTDEQKSAEQQTSNMEKQKESDEESDESNDVFDESEKLL